MTAELVLEPSGVLRVRGLITNVGGDVLDVAAVRLLMPLPPRAGEVLDQTGRWAREASPQRLPFAFGSHRRASRRGRSGHDGPLLLVAGTPGFGFRSGEVWGAHVAWSGDREHLAERLPEGAGGHAGVIGGGELLAPARCAWPPVPPTPPLGPPGVVRCGARRAQCAASPDAPRPALAPSHARPLVLNTWEAVYFDHRVDRLLALADAAADVGVERFVLDDGWFLGRRDDHRGLGDWTVDPIVWPHGLHPLVDHVRTLGLQFGLWVEPEMVNLDSDLVRAHPNWVLGPAVVASSTWRNQHVLDVARPDVFAHLLERLGRAGRGVLVGLPQVGPQPRRPDGRARGRSARRARRDVRGVPAHRRAAVEAPRIWRSSPARPGVAASTSASSSAPTASGPQTPTTRWSGSRSSAGPRCSSLRSWSAPTWVPASLTPPVARPSSRCVGSRRCSVTQASSATSRR